MFEPNHCMSILRFFSRFTCLLIVLLLVRCANPVSPEGGLKDTKPPVVVTSFPDNYCINYKEKNIRIVFNEFIQLKDQYTQINVSPPAKTIPDVKVKGKTLSISLADSLLSNTTYSINFGKSIQDLREGNVLKDFKFVFSTGSYLDSLSIRGKVINAFDDAPQKDITAMLYTRTTDTIPIDSMPFHLKPSYIAKTDESGSFIFENVKSGPLLLFAIMDKNGNDIFDLPNEKIAFCDSLIHGTYVVPPKVDTAKKDTLQKKDVPTIKDTIKSIVSEAPSYTLRLFEETDSVQKINRAFLAQKDEVTLYFRFPAHEPRFRPLNFSADQAWSLTEMNPGKDTVNFWLKPGIADSLIMEVTDNKKVIDTLRISLLDKTAKRKKDKKETDAVRRVFLSSNVRDGNLNMFRKNPQLTFSYPIRNANFRRILLTCNKDTIHPVCVFTDSLKRRLMIKTKWIEDKNYHLIFPDSTFYTYNGLTNDSVILIFKTQMLRDFGSILITMKMDDPDRKNLVQLLDEKENVLEQQVIIGPGKIHYEYLSPGKYKVKCIYDRNRNGRWDTGHYRTKLQPEEVFYFPSVIEVRANWDIEEIWNVDKVAH